MVIFQAHRRLKGPGSTPTSLDLCSSGGTIYVLCADGTTQAAYRWAQLTDLKCTKAGDSPEAVASFRCSKVPKHPKVRDRAESLPADLMYISHAIRLLSVYWCTKLTEFEACNPSQSFVSRLNFITPALMTMVAWPMFRIPPPMSSEIKDD